MKISSYEFGKQGEQQAIDFLSKKGYSIIEVNWRYQHKEIDIVAECNDELRIVEVKTRTSAVWQTIDEIVGATKQKNIIAAADAYMQQNNVDKNVVFDIVYIVQNDIKQRIELIQDAFHSYDSEI
ncbi:MAG: YraN family protein [Prevotellaceae bacterium]|jgi:putative endonuclease|nr:YraN family protein [Prevotellaceae bacterium]